MCFPEFYSILIKKSVPSLPHMHLQTTTSMKSIFNIFEKNENIITISTYLINLSHCFFFHNSNNCFLGSLLQSPVFILRFISGIFFIYLYASFSFVSHPLLHCSTTMYLHCISYFFLYPHTSSQAFKTTFLKTFP